jgi:hypothetical protein
MSRPYQEPGPVNRPLGAATRGPLAGHDRLEAGPRDGRACYRRSPGRFVRSAPAGSVPLPTLPLLSHRGGRSSGSGGQGPPLRSLSSLPPCHRRREVCHHFTPRDATVRVCAACGMGMKKRARGEIAHFASRPKSYPAEIEKWAVRGVLVASTLSEALRCGTFRVGARLMVDPPEGRTGGASGR